MRRHLCGILLHDSPHGTVRVTLTPRGQELAAW
jgi:hypothetical protein